MNGLLKGVAGKLAAPFLFNLTSDDPALMLPGNALLFRPEGVRAATVDSSGQVRLLPIVLGTTASA